MGNNYFNSLTFAERRRELGLCRFTASHELGGTDALKGKKIVIVGCGAQGLNQGLNLRDSGLDVAYALRRSAIRDQRPSYRNAADNGFAVGTYEEMIPTADLVANLTPDKQHSAVVAAVMPLMKQGAALLYAHGFNIVEEGMKIRDDITVVMVAPKSPGSEVRAEYVRGFGVPTLIAVHKDNDPEGRGLEIAKAYCCGTGGDRAGVLESSFVAEVKSDLMGEQTVLCGLLQTASILCYDKMVSEGISETYAAALVQYGWQTVAEALKRGGVTLMLERLSGPAKIRAFDLAENLKAEMRPLFEHHMEEILSGAFSDKMMRDWAASDADLLKWRAETANTPFEKAEALGRAAVPEQTYFDNGILMVAFLKAGVELAFEAMTDAGIQPESAYYEALHETPLIADTIARKRLAEMNVTISDTAEYGNYLFSNACIPLLKPFMESVGSDVVGKGLAASDAAVDNRRLAEINEAVCNHPIEQIGRTLRRHMGAMQAI